MPRKRMIDPSFWRDEKIAQCSFMERLLFEGLWTFAEDSGAGRANPLLLKADIFPYDTLREADIQKSLEKLMRLSLITLYENNEQQYYFVNNFQKHQTINRPTPSVLPVPNDSDIKPLTDDSLSAHGGLTTEDKLREDKLSKENIRGKSSRFTPPTLEEVQAYCRERNNSVEPQKFFDYFTAGGWKDAKGEPVRNWKQKIITWEGGRDGKRPANNPTPDKSKYKPTIEL